MNQKADLCCVLLASPRYKDHVALEVPGCFVVLAMGDLPGEIRHEESRMAEPANGVIEDLRWRKRLMSALMSQDPEARTDHSLYDGVDSPQDTTDRCRGDILGRQEGMEEVEDGCEGYEVSGDIVKATSSGTFEAMGGDGVADLLDGEVRDLELVAIGIQHLSVTLVENDF